MLLALGLAGCTEAPEEGGQWGPPPALQVSVVVPGQVVSVSLAGLPAGATAYLARGTGLGVGPCPPLLAGDCLDVVGAALVGTAVADASGVARWSTRMSLTTAPGSATAWQAAAVLPGGAALSDAVGVLVSHPDELCDPTGGGQWPPGFAAMECEVLARLNAVREAGFTCPGATGYQPPTHPLSMNGPLHLAARVHTSWMAASTTLTHASPGGPLGDTLQARVQTVGYGRWRRLSETIGRGQATPEGIVADWLASPNHCGDVLSRRVRDMGIGREASAAGTAYWTAVQAEPFL
jgi:uncharacterized protein YkwD